MDGPLFTFRKKCSSTPSKWIKIISRNNKCVCLFYYIIIVFPFIYSVEIEQNKDVQPSSKYVIIFWKSKIAAFDDHNWKIDAFDGNNSISPWTCCTSPWTNCTSPWTNFFQNKEVNPKWVYEKSQDKMLERKRYTRDMRI